MMPEIVYYVAASLDGYIAAPDGNVDWLTPYFTPEGEKNYNDFYASTDALLLGRRTYQQILGFGTWPYPGKPAFVLARTATKAINDDITITTKTPADIAAELSARNLRRTWLVGGAQLASAFRSEGLISEYIINVIPMLLGNGVPLLTPPSPVERLRLTGTTQLPLGIVQLRYLRDLSNPRQ